jgi:hypothetical protein
MSGPNPNPNVANTGGGQIKSNQMEPPRGKSKANPNQMPPQKTQMGPNGGARSPIWRVNRLSSTKIIVDIAIPNP